MAIPEERMAVLSTAHLAHEEVGRIADAFDTHALIGMGRDEGFLIHTDSPSEHFPHLAFVQGYLLGAGFVWALFDRDAMEVDELPTHHW